MKNLVLITSVINPSKEGLSYTNVRSIFNSDERFEQTKKTIQSIKEKIPFQSIFLLECSILSETQKQYFLENTDIFINIMDTKETEIINYISSKSKSLGEGTQTIYALEYILNNNIQFTNLFKISGRYWLSEIFDFEKFNNNYTIIKYIEGNINNCFTALYKISNKEIIYNLLEFLKNSKNLMFNCIGYEVLFSIFLKNIHVVNIEQIGLTGYVSCDGSYYYG